ncbi:MAG: lipase family protein [Cyanobacteria bacterium Co-bin8]|nr:lipase family protein [Cyanobacteria bacterium Co-bin8]
MGIRHCITLLGTTLVVTASSALAQMPSEVPSLEPMTGQIYQSEWNQRSLYREVLPLWLIAASLAGGALIALTWLHLYQQQRWRQRIELARQETKAFRAQEAVRNVLDILDYEEYRTFYVKHPQDGRLLTFEASDDLLRRALRSHDQMVKTRQGLDEIKQLTAQQPDAIDAKTVAVFKRYETEEFVIEIILRDWFDSFLGGLENFDTLIEAGLISASELKPFVIHWIKLIGDRRYRRKGGSGFYDQFFHYIHWAGYSRVQKLFERYGYKILPPPYSSHDFAQISQEQSSDTHRAISLAKAAYLVYEDQGYVNDIVGNWVSSEDDNRWMKMSPREYVVEVLNNWLKEGKQPSKSTLKGSFFYLDKKKTDTQAFIFCQGEDIILAFRGSQQLNDWRTNFKIRLNQFTVLADQQPVPPLGRVHRGFLAAWHSVETEVLDYLRKRWTPGSRLWITGHSLGGALAAMAAVSLESQNFQVSGLYTFGQPRIADWKLVNYINSKMRDRIFRYANNNDIVPLIPPPILPWVPTRVYGHMGHFRYFDWRGNLQRQSFPTERLPDRLLGYLMAIGRPGLDSIGDHKMEFYLANLQTALEKEQEEAKIEAEKKNIHSQSVAPLTPDPIN